MTVTATTPRKIAASQRLRELMTEDFFAGEGIATAREYKYALDREGLQMTLGTLIEVHSATRRVLELLDNSQLLRR